MLWSKKEILQQLRRGEFLATPQVDIVGNGSDDIYHLLLLVKLQALLREIAETDGLANHDTSLVRLHLSQQHLDEGRLPRAVIPHDTHLLKTGEVIVEVLENDYIIETLGDILALENLGTDIHVVRFQPQTCRSSMRCFATFSNS